MVSHSQFPRKGQLPSTEAPPRSPGVQGAEGVRRGLYCGFPGGTGEQGAQAGMGWFESFRRALGPRAVPRWLGPRCLEYESPTEEVAGAPGFWIG